jgi:glycosyltransferase involved in cell wall biosynthesis
MLKILLVGDNSGLHLSLSKGLKGLGYKVTFIGYGNSWRENCLDINLSSKHKGVLGKVLSNLSPFFNIKYFIGHDIAQFVGLKSFNSRFGIDFFLTKVIKNFNKKTFLLGAGCASNNIKLYRDNNFDICHRCLKMDQNSKVCITLDKTAIKKEKHLNSMVDGFIPTIYDYKKDALNNIIPVPVHMSDFKLCHRVPNKKIRFFHGISRAGFKGSDIIVTALNSIKSKYPDTVEVIIVEKIPYNEYIDIVETVDVVVDQLYALGLGMNALFSMSMGKLVVTNDPSKTYDLIAPGENIPILSLGLNGINLLEQLEWIVHNREKAFSISKKSRKFVEKYHSSYVVAKKYIKEWSEE